MGGLFLTLLFALLLWVLSRSVAASAFKPGIGARIYRNTGTYGSPTWTAVNLVKDLTLSMPWDFVEAGSRSTRAKLYGKARTDLGAQLSIRADDADAGYGAFADAHCSPSSLIDVLILDAAITVEGARGARFHAGFSLTGKAEEADGSVYPQMDLKPGFHSDGFPATVVMGAGSAPTFTTL